MAETFDQYVGKIASRFDTPEWRDQLSSVPRWLGSGEVSPRSDGSDQVLKTDLFIGGQPDHSLPKSYHPDFLICKKA
jgi:hypothetical protein